ncbi:hypothetical protein P691DRAFT_807517 [Macrolepiota fuliginosa MF-IS2]|uniref:Uncharacterized protein n=1 Tax=Macrolepiota fuliginosa MF-IS2 TaxID=1400762 RepID=A0A9P5X4H3_9AGAR|nr:hypothetical protein P691DRAFT_807517 [Macrolepiota fuliginosa MF-IS2]
MSLPTPDCDLPRYSPSAPVPDYSFEPTCGERILERTPRSVRPTPESTFVKSVGKTTVVLHNQEENAAIPTYGRTATISGSVLFDSDDRTCEVVLKIRGKLETTSSEGGAKTTTLVDNKHILWSDHQKNEQCPSQICFSVRLPSTFRDGGEDRALPPSYLVELLNAPVLFVRSGYSLQILITRRRSQKVNFLNKTKRVVIPFEYLPRTRPNRPIVTPLCFFSGVKSTPEEWHQTITPMKTPASAKLGSIFTQVRAWLL